MEVFRVSSATIRFGEFELDQHSGELRRNGIKLRLQEQPLRILQILLEQPGKLVTREELQGRIWPSDTFVDFDHGINNAVKRLREALSDLAETPHFIETLPRRGYRFIASISALPNPDVQGIRSIAVLPFLNLSADPDSELFCDGTTEEIINALSHVKNLRVVARTSAFAFKGKHLDLRLVGQQLNVQTVLEGSIRRLGGHLRITAQLVNAADGYHLWSEKYDREMKDVFAVQEEIANSIAQHFQLTLDGQQPLLKAGTASLEAFKFYTQGRCLLFQRGVRLFAAAECLKKAVSIDSKYALARAALADAYNMVAFYGLCRPETCLPQAKEAAQFAIALDPSLAEAHTALAMSHLLYDRDGLSAQKEFRISLELNPRNSLTRTWYGFYYLQWVEGHFDEGLIQADQAVQMDPLSAYARAMKAFSYVPINTDRCLETALETLQIEPDSFLGRWAQFTARNLMGRLNEAAHLGESTLTVSGRSAWIMASLARIYAQMGRRADSAALYMELLWRSKREYVAPAILAWAACAAGEQDEAIRLAEEAYTIGDPSLIAAKYWPDFTELREDPRFQEILKRR